MISLVLTLAASAIFCGSYLKLAHRWQLLAHPNERSSHHLPTPHGGGVPLFLAWALGLLAAALLDQAWSGPYLLISLGALLLVAVGVLDDLLELSAPLRFAIYCGCCAMAAVELLQPQGQWVAWGLVLVAGISLLWLLNLYNFMDGIDGIAALQCIQACVTAALLSWFLAGDPAYVQYCLLLAAAHAGFLLWNWPPARLFMGDAGSVPTGFLLGGLALLGAVQGQLPLACWLILLGPFIADASYTLLWRMATGQPFTRPHRLHTYQRLSRHWGGHLPVDMALLGLNTLWQTPLAVAAALWPKFSILFVILAYLPLLPGMAKAHKLG